MKNREIFIKTNAYDLLMQMNENLKEDNFIIGEGCCVLNCFLRENIVSKRCANYITNNMRCEDCIQSFLQEETLNG